MSGAEFDALTPGQFAEHRRFWVEREKRLDARAGVIAATLANCHRDARRTRRPFEPADFFTSLAGRRATARSRSGRSLIRDLISFTGGLPDDWKGPTSDPAPGDTGRETPD